MSSSQNQIYFQTNKSSRTIFIIGNSVDNLEFKTQRLNFEFWDQLIKNSAIELSIDSDKDDIIKQKNVEKRLDVIKFIDVLIDIGSS